MDFDDIDLYIFISKFFEFFVDVIYFSIIFIDNDIGVWSMNCDSNMFEGMFDDYMCDIIFWYMGI